MFGLSVKNFGHDAIYHHSLSFASQQKVILISRGSFSPFLGSRVCRFVSQIMLTSHQNVLQRSFVVRQNPLSFRLAKSKIDVDVSLF